MGRMRDGYGDFLAAAEEHIAQGKHGEGWLGTASGLENASAAGHRLRQALLQSLETADEQLRRFDSLFAAGHNHVLWAADYKDLFGVLHKLFAEWGAKSACFPQLDDVNDLNGEASPLLYRELGLPFFLQDEKMELGEEGKVQFFHPDGMLTDSGMLLFCNMGQKATAMLNNSKINIFLVTLEQTLCSTPLAEMHGALRHGEKYRGMLLYKGTGACSNYLVVVDNGRTEVLRREWIRPALACMGCGRCHGACPVEQAAGSEAYNNVFTGPLACVALPYMEDERCDGYAAEACTMCGRCDEVCPLHLPMREMIAAARHDLYERGAMGKGQRRMASQLGKFLQSRGAMNKGAFIKSLLFGKFVSEEYKRHFSPTPFAEKNK